MDPVKLMWLIGILLYLVGAGLTVYSAEKKTRRETGAVGWALERDTEMAMMLVWPVVLLGEGLEIIENKVRGRA